MTHEWQTEKEGGFGLPGPQGLGSLMGYLKGYIRYMGLNPQKVIN